MGAALGVTADFLDRAAALVEAKVDVVVVDTAHGHTRRVIDTVESMRKRFPELDLIAGNVGTYEGAADLAAAGVSAVKVGMGPGSICTTRVVSGAGMPTCRHGKRPQDDQTGASGSVHLAARSHRSASPVRFRPAGRDTTVHRPPFNVMP